MRYRLLPYLYTAFHGAHARGTLVAAPLWAACPGDAATHAIDAQWMLGDALLVSPVVIEGATSVDAYFPVLSNSGGNGSTAATTVWYSLFDHTAIAGAPRVATLETPLTVANAHVASGAVVPMQQPGALSTAESRATPFTLLVGACDPRPRTALAHGVCASTMCAH